MAGNGTTRPYESNTTSQEQDANSALTELDKELYEWSKDFESAYQFLKERKILASTMHCSVCQEEMSLVKYRETKRFRCKTHRCQTASLTKGSFLEKSQLSFSGFIRLVYAWSKQLPVVIATDTCKLNHSTIIQWYQSLRDIASRHLMSNSYQIGGSGHIVEIDELLMSKTRYNREKLPQQWWVFGGWDRNDKIGFLVLVDDRSSETLTLFIKKFIKPGTIIYSDYCGAYRSITAINVKPPYEYHQVNHEQNFADPLTGVHTNNLECFWENAKRRFKAMMGVQSTTMESHLDEFLWREIYGKNEKEALDNILQHISEWYAV